MRGLYAYYCKMEIKFGEALLPWNREKGQASDNQARNVLSDMKSKIHLRNDKLFLQKQLRKGGSYDGYFRNSKRSYANCKALWGKKAVSIWFLCKRHCGQ